MIKEAFADVPVIGFFGNGEISNDRLYTYTGILSLFIDAEEKGAE
jgi:small ligand-binding sensory domain FIST